MSLPLSPSLLEETLRTVARRYRLPPMAAAVRETSPATALAMAIEKAREARSAGEAPDPALMHCFIEALGQMIREAMRPGSGDPAFQAMVLRHEAVQVREYASLSSHADRDARLIRTMVNAIAHPAKLQRLAPGPQREGLARLQGALSSASWSALSDSVRDLLALPEVLNSSLQPGLARLLDSPALERLRRLDALASDDLVRRYQSLWSTHAPRSGSPTAVAQGSVSRQRGAAVEALAMQAIKALADRLNGEEGARAAYRVVTSMRVPASIPGSSHRAKSEWDVVLLRRPKAADTAAAWDVCLLVEAKASVDAAATDLPRLMRGLGLLAHAEENAVYAFRAQQGVVHLRGASLGALTVDESGLARTVLYCCDAPAESTSRLLSVASRMQLLSARASLEFAAGLAKQRQAGTQGLEQVWHQLLESPRWSALLHQYPMLRQARELMVHADDLMAAVRDAAEDGGVAGASLVSPAR
ncbi:3-deoxy-D-arabino-heptulosonate 7-phosphate synthase [Pollutimonas sp. M17]|uniref:3-deoxy-D-arabino-heptulosonate 7-phosphate synthase n=1 Tax=Pollutimonas sp. M17 TaxID=2962065 RepID=UPI0021F46502|nr:3-deoxy-D-arabino-heptulosonate 7-phosphate synthase [Pollutimonas sp. M17]UYO92140.1 3-deoxy-D-arabino-heptulosonate 7-phosphate synthase [Pollutimonas sp. M17]